MTEQKLKDKVALITGANSGMGFDTARAFIEAGARVIINGRRAEAVQEAVAKLGPQATGIVADVADLNALNTLYEQVQAQFGKIDILFANAGIASMRHVNEVDEAYYDNMMDINVKGLFFTVQKALPVLKDGASILLNASVVQQKGMPNFSVYAASKAAVRSFARSFVSDLKDRQIRVNVISPGPIETPIYGKMELPEATVQAMGQSFAEQVPLGRFGTGDEIAKAAVFLASSDASYINGVELAIDGGFTQV